MSDGLVTCRGCKKRVALTSFGRCPICGLDASSTASSTVPTAPASPVAEATPKAKVEAEPNRLQLADAHDQLLAGRDPETTARQLRLQGHPEWRVRETVAAATRERQANLRRSGLYLIAVGAPGLALVLLALWHGYMSLKLLVLVPLTAATLLKGLFRVVFAM